MSPQVQCILLHVNLSAFLFRRVPSNDQAQIFVSRECNPNESRSQVLSGTGRREPWERGCEKRSLYRLMSGNPESRKFSLVQSEIRENFCS